MQESIRGIVDEAGDAPLAAGKFVRGEAGKSAGKRLAKLLAEAAGLADPDQYERHHAMRIASKRLRYTLELARPVYAADATSVADLTAIVDAVKKLQTLLGEIHDCDVWIDNFAEFARRPRARSNFTSAVHSTSSACGPASIICGRSERTVGGRFSPSGDLLAGTARSSGLGSAGGYLGTGRRCREAAGQIAAEVRQLEAGKVSQG